MKQRLRKGCLNFLHFPARSLKGKTIQIIKLPLRVTQILTTTQGLLPYSKITRSTDQEINSIINPQMELNQANLIFRIDKDLPSLTNQGDKQIRVSINHLCQYLLGPIFQSKETLDSQILTRNILLT